MDLGGSSSGADGFAQECRFLGAAFNQMHMGSRHIRKRAGDHQARKPSPGAEIDPNSRLWRQPQQLKRVGNMAGPKRWFSGRRNQIGVLLPRQQHGDKALEPFQCFT